MRARKRALVFGVIASMLSAPAFAYTISGTIPANGHTVEIALHQPLKAGNITFTFSAPPVNAGVKYDVGFCVGPRDNPCGSTLSHQVNVPAGETRTFTIDALVFTCNILTAGKGTGVATPYSVEVTQP